MTSCKIQQKFTKKKELCCKQNYSLYFNVHGRPQLALESKASRSESSACALVSFGKQVQGSIDWVI
jgi:hypothetical protein